MKRCRVTCVDAGGGAKALFSSSSFALVCPLFLPRVCTSWPVIISKRNQAVMTREKFLPLFHIESFAVGRFNLKLWSGPSSASCLGNWTAGQHVPQSWEACGWHADTRPASGQRRAGRCWTSVVGWMSETHLSFVSLFASLGLARAEPITGRGRLNKSFLGPSIFLFKATLRLAVHDWT